MTLLAGGGAIEREARKVRRAAKGTRNDELNRSAFKLGQDAEGLRLLAESAGFTPAFTGIALSCDTGSAWPLPRLVGRAKALELLYEPRTIRADEAVSLGLANRVVESLAELTPE